MEVLTEELQVLITGQTVCYLEAFNALLDDMDASAEEGQKYVLKFVVYTGATGNETHESYQD